MPKPFKTFVLSFPPSANTCWRSIVRNNRVMVLVSAKAREYRQSVAADVALNPEYLPLEGRLGVSIYLQAPTRRKYDIDNRIKTVLDALQHAGVFEDDEAVDVLEVRRGPIVEGGCCTVMVELLDQKVGSNGKGST